VPRSQAKTEDDVELLLFSVFDESKSEKVGEALHSTVSELWVLDAMNKQ
jgi:hypothetical protein